LPICAQGSNSQGRAEKRMEGPRSVPGINKSQDVMIQVSGKHCTHCALF